MDNDNSNVNNLRNEIRAKRDSLSKEESLAKSKIIADKLLEIIEAKYDTDEYNNNDCHDVDMNGAKNVLCFYPIKSEVNLIDMYKELLHRGYMLYFPVTLPQGIQFFLVTDFSEFKLGAYNVPEPVNRAALFEEDDAVVITPGMVFDREGNRIGYGGGYYDGFFAEHKSLTSIGVCYDFQLVDKIEAREWDIPVSKVITDRDNID